MSIDAGANLRVRPYSKPLSRGNPLETTEFRFAFYARDFERSVAFYRDILQMEQIGGWDRGEDKGALLSMGSGRVIEIFAEPYEGGPAADGINLAIKLPDVAAVESSYNRLSKIGADVQNPPRDYHWGHRSFLIHDPDGIKIYLFCDIPEFEPEE